MRVLVVDEALPFPPDSGKRIRTAELLTRLARKHEITLCYHDEGTPPVDEESARDAGLTDDLQRSAHATKNGGLHALSSTSHRRCRSERQAARPPHRIGRYAGDRNCARPSPPPPTNARHV